MRGGFIAVIGVTLLVVLIATAPVWISFFVLVAAALGHPK